MRSFYEFRLTSGSTYSFWLDGDISEVEEMVEDNMWIGDEDERIRCSNVEAIKFDETEEEFYGTNRTR